MKAPADEQLAVRKDDPYHREEFARRVTCQLGTVTADVVTAEDLIIAKLLWLKQGSSRVRARLDARRRR